MWQAILIGSFLMSFGINNFFVPHHILDGGIIGLGLIFHYQWGLEIGITILVISIPIYLFAWKKFKSYFFNSIPGFVVSALFIDLFSFLTFDSINFGPLPSAIFGGILLGIGVGIMFLYDISTGGLDLLAQMLADLFSVNVGVLIFLIDLLVIISGIFVITSQEIILSAIAVSATGISTFLITMKQKRVLR